MSSRNSNLVKDPDTDFISNKCNAISEITLVTLCHKYTEGEAIKSALKRR